MLPGDSACEQTIVALTTVLLCFRLLEGMFANSL
jgi:hypothetical protein